MAAWKWLLTVWRWFETVLHAIRRSRITALLLPSSTAAETSCESDLEKLQRAIKRLGDYDLHDILRQPHRVEWCEWILKIDENDNAIEIANKFHQDFRKSILSSSVADQIDIIEKSFLDFQPDDSIWPRIKYYFKQARELNDPEWIINAYTWHQLFTEHLNKHSAVNTYHILKLYCTLLNCPVLAQTQEYTEAITRIFFHPKLDGRLVRKAIVYRGIRLKDKKLVANYREGATIITTTFLSTSTIPDIAQKYFADAPENAISIFCTYNINNTNRHTALDLKNLSYFGDEEEILILRYVPFIIKSVERLDDGRRMTICFDECEEQCHVEEKKKLFLFPINTKQKACPYRPEDIKVKLSCEYESNKS